MLGWCTSPLGMGQVARHAGIRRRPTAGSCHDLNLQAQQLLRSHRRPPMTASAFLLPCRLQHGPFSAGGYFVVCGRSIIRVGPPTQPWAPPPLCPAWAPRMRPTIDTSDPGGPVVHTAVGVVLAVRVGPPVQSRVHVYLQPLYVVPRVCMPQSVRE